MVKYEGVVDRIQQLSEEQHRLYLVASSRELTNAERRRLGEIKTELQTLWLNRKQERTRYRDPLNDYIEQPSRKAA